MTLEIEVDALDTGVPHLKARCLLSLVPGLATLLASDAGSLLPPPPSPLASSNLNSTGQAAQAARLGNSTGSNGGGGGWGKDELALAGLVKRARLEYTKSGYALEEAAEGASLKAARVSDGACLVLEWGVPPETGKARLKFSVRIGEWAFGGRIPRGRGGGGGGTLAEHYGRFVVWRRGGEGRGGEGRGGSTVVQCGVV